MRGVTGLLLFALVVVLLHDNAEGEARLHCQPIHVEPPQPCSLKLRLENGYLPNRCKNA